MEAKSVRGLELDECDTCHSVWFDNAELEAYVAKDPTWSGERVLRHADLSEAVRESERRCPRCGAHTLFVGAFLGVEFLKCRLCYGILLPPENQHTLLARASVYRERPEGNADGPGRQLLAALADILIAFF